MFTTRADEGGPASGSTSIRYPAEVDRAQPLPRSPNFPYTAGSARTARTASVPLRVRSRPHPARIKAGRASAYSRAASRIRSAGHAADLGRPLRGPGSTAVR